LKRSQSSAGNTCDPRPAHRGSPTAVRPPGSSRRSGRDLHDSRKPALRSSWRISTRSSDLNDKPPAMPAGDICIQRVAKAIEQSVRPGDDAVFSLRRRGIPDRSYQCHGRSPHGHWRNASVAAVEALVIVNPGIHPVAGSAGRGDDQALGVSRFAQEDAGPEMVGQMGLTMPSTTPSVPAGTWLFFVERSRRRRRHAVRRGPLHHRPHSLPIRRKILQRNDRFAANRSSGTDFAWPTQSIGLPST